MGVLQPIEVARLEETRCARAITEIRDGAEPWCGGWMHYDKPDSWANFANGMDFDHEFTAGDFETLLDFYAQRDAPARIGITPFNHSSLVDRLREHRFVIHEFECVFAADLSTERLGAEAFEEPDGLVVSVLDVSEDEAVHAFARLSTSGFLKPGDDPEKDVPIMIAAARHPRAVNLVATIDGAPAAAGSVEIAGDIAALYGVTTLEPFRGRGIQRAMIERRLEVARERGCRVAVIASEPGIATERNALCAGFTPSYTHVQMERPLDV